VIEGTLADFTDVDKALFPDEIRADPTYSLHLVVRLTATVADRETVAIDRSAPEGETGRQLSRDRTRSWLAGIRFDEAWLGPSRGPSVVHDRYGAGMIMVSNSASHCRAGVFDLITRLPARPSPKRTVWVCAASRGDRSTRGGAGA
jgi:hypothetical protein